MRYLLVLFFFLIYAGDSLGLKVGLGPGLSLKNLLLYAILVGIALNAAVARNRNLELLSVLVPFAILILYALMTWITDAFILDVIDYDVRGSFIVLKSSLVDQYLTFLVFFFGIQHQKDAFWLMRALIWIAIVGNIVTLIDGFNIPNLGLIEGRVRDDRFEGFVGEANGYGQFLVLFLPASVALYLTESGKSRLLSALGVFATGLALIMTGSRGSYVGCLAGTMFAAFFLRRSIPSHLFVRAGFIATTIFALVLSVALVAGYSDLFTERLARFGGSSHVATSGRSTIWATAIEAMIENPISFVTGYGFNAYESSRSFYAATHNMYLTYLYNLGVIGLSLFLIVFGRILVTARSIMANADASVRPFLVALVFGLSSFLIAIFFSEYHVAGYLLWAYLGVAMRIAMRVKATLSEESHGAIQYMPVQPSRG